MHRYTYGSHWSKISLTERNALSKTKEIHCKDLLPGNYCKLITREVPEDCGTPGLAKECCASCSAFSTRTLQLFEKAKTSGYKNQINEIMICSSRSYYVSILTDSSNGEGRSPLHLAIVEVTSSYILAMTSIILRFEGVCSRSKSTKMLVFIKVTSPSNNNRY